MKISKGDVVCAQDGQLALFEGIRNGWVILYFDMYSNGNPQKHLCFPSVLNILTYIGKL